VIAYDTDMTVTAWNRAAESLYGIAAADVLGRPLPDAIRRDETDVVPIWDPFVDGMDGWRGRSVHRDADGYEIAIETKCVPLADADGKERGWVMVDREVVDD